MFLARHTNNATLDDITLPYRECKDNLSTISIVVKIVHHSQIFWERSSEPTLHFQSLIGPSCSGKSLNLEFRSCCSIKHFHVPWSFTLNMKLLKRRRTNCQWSRMENHCEKILSRNALRNGYYGVYISPTLYAVVVILKLLTFATNQKKKIKSQICYSRMLA